MANLKGFTVAKGQTGANTTAGGDEISMMLIASPAASGLALNVPTVVNNMDDVKALGITAAHDLEYFANCWRHLREFYRTAGEGTKLYIMLVAQATTQVQMFTDSAEGADDAPAKVLTLFAEGEGRQLATVANPTAEPVSLNGISADVYNSIALAQGFAVWAFNNFMPLQVLLEGRDYGGASATAADLSALPNLEATKVSVIIGQDFEYADTLPADDGDETDVYMRTLADVGTALGVCSKATVNQNIGDNEAFNLTDATLAAWMVAGLSNHTKCKDQISSLQTLEDKKYIFGLKYVGMSGVRFNGDHTCVATVIDAEGNINEHTISYGRTLDKASRELRKAYLPKVKTTQPVDPTTGKLPTGVVAYFNNIGLDVFGDMQDRGEISQGFVSVDPNSDLVVEKLLKITRFSVVPYGYANAIEGTINLKQNV